MMKSVLALFLGMIYAGLAVAGVQDFTIVNKTGIEINQLYISPASTETWDKDILSVDTLLVGDECDILVSRDENAEVWDLMIVSPKGASVKWPGLRLNDFTKIILAIEKGEPMAYYE